MYQGPTMYQVMLVQYCHRPKPKILKGTVPCRPPKSPPLVQHTALCINTYTITYISCTAHNHHTRSHTITYCFPVHYVLLDKRSCHLDWQFEGDKSTTDRTVHFHMPAHHPHPRSARWKLKSSLPHRPSSNQPAIR